MIVVTVECDGCGERAGNWGSVTRLEARRAARDEGFVRRAGRDLCAKCKVRP
jgi:hypothetical protein